MLEPDLQVMSESQFLWSHNGGSDGASIWHLCHPIILLAMCSYDDLYKSCLPFCSPSHSWLWSFFCILETTWLRCL